MMLRYTYVWIPDVIRKKQYSTYPAWWLLYKHNNPHSITCTHTCAYIQTFIMWHSSWQHCSNGLMRLLDYQGDFIPEIAGWDSKDSSNMIEV